MHTTLKLPPPVTSRNFIQTRHCCSEKGKAHPTCKYPELILSTNSLRFDPKIVNILSEIWAWVDINKDGSLDVVEYSRVYKVLGAVLWGKKKMPDETTMRVMAEEEFRYALLRVRAACPAVQSCIISLQIRY